MDVDRFRARLERDYGIVIAEGQVPGQSMFRIGHVGHLTDEELDYFRTSFLAAFRAETGETLSETGTESTT